MKKKLTRLFSVLLAAVLVLGTLPVSAMGTDVANPPASAVDDTPAEVSAAEPEEASVVDETPDGEKAQSGEVEAAATYASADVQYKIVHLDCGRKYFSKDWIIALLYEMQNDGYNQLQLAFGNDGLRFLLNDMSFTANGTTYDNDTVVAKVKAGNKTQNNSGDERYLTEAEMDEIIVKANELGIEIVPLLNLPGHANAILDIADDAYNASGSDNTLNVSNAEAVNFAMAIFQKYVDYFAAKGCRFFNFGADEYANDADDGGAFSFSRLGQTGYANFAAFINGLAGYIDGKSVDGANMIPRAFNDGLYYMNSTDRRVYSGFYTMDTTTYSNIKKIQCCYWSSGWDSYPVAYADTISNNGHEMINTNGDFYYVLGKDDKFDSDYSYASNFTNSVFMGSTISKPVGSMFCIWCDYPNAETETEVAQKTRLVLRAMAQRMDNQTVSVSDNVVANGFNADGTINNTVDDSLIKISLGDSTEAATSGELTVDGTMTLKANKQVAWSVNDETVVQLTSADATAAYSNEVTATAVNVKALKAGNATITAAAGGKTATYAVTVSEPGTKNVTVTVGGTTEVTVDGNYPGPFTTGNTGIATVQTKVNENDGNVSYKLATLAEGTFYVSASANDTEPSATLTFEDAGNGEYYIKDSDGNYIYPVARFSYSSFNWSYAINQSKEAVAVTVNSNGTVSISKNYTTRYWGDKDAYLTLSGNSFSATGDKTSLYLYEPVPGDKTYTTDITFKGVAVGTTSVQIGDVTYNINVIAEDLTQVTPLTIEYWITNARPIGTTNKQNSVSITATQAYSEEGVEVADLVDPKAQKDGRTQEYWKTVMLDTQKTNNSTSGTELQTEKNGDDETLNGTTFTKVRYWEGKWQVYTTTWVDVNRTQVNVNYTDKDESKTYSGDRNQLVAYYMEVVDINNANGESELHVNAADWGTKGDGTGNWGYSPEPDRCSVSVQLVYEDSTKNPAKTTANALKSKTIVYGYWAGGRGLGTMLFTGENNYEIYKITAETGDMESTTSGQTVTVTSFTWDENEEVVWGGDDQEPSASASIGNPARKPSYEGSYDNLAWNTGSYNRNNAILIRVYVKAKETPDSLHVHYIDATNGKNEEFYSYNINVKQGTTFDTGFALENGALKNNTVTNNVGVTQTVESDLTKMTSIGTQYRYSKFTCINAERDSEGKDVYLYYTFDDKVSYIVDFGTPVKIQPGDVNDALVSTDVELTSVAVTGANHGTVEISGTTFTYTPDSRFVSSQEGETLTVTYTGKLQTDAGIQNGSKAYQVYIYPASNVLYEEGFLTGADGWTDASVEHTTAQETQKVGDTDKNVFGYDASYAGDKENNIEAVTGQNGAWTIDGLAPKQLSAALTTSFYGNTFDLIGDCDPTTGRVMLVITKNGANGKHTSIVDIDTRYYDGSISQVPLAHVDMTTGKFGDDDALCTVKVYASGLEAKDVDAPRGVATMSLDGAATEIDDLLAQVLEENNLTMDDVEYTSTSVMENGALTAVASEVPGDAIATYANDTIHFDAGDHVAISGFRVYRSTTDDVAKNNYPDNEKNLTYWNILDAVNGETITAYRDNNKVTNIEVANYEANGGPQNEIYLRGNSSVAVKVTDPTVDSIQVSLRAVNETASYNKKEITTNAELYYTIKKDNNGNFVITNTGDGILAIGNVKIPSSITQADITPASEMNLDELLESVNATYSAVNEEPEVFVPETFTAKTTSTPVIRNKVVTLKVNVSSDVAYITVNGVKYTRTGLQGLFQATRTIRVVNTVPKNQTKTYEIVAYNADGVASETITVTG